MAGENDKLHIRLHIYDADIPVTVVRKDEYDYRESAKLVNSTINAYADHFKGKKGDKEILYMAMIDIALKLKKSEKHNDTQAYDDILHSITSEIEDALGVGKGLKANK